MAVLIRKIKASTLMETLVATVLIVIVFMVSSTVLNNLFAGSISQNDNQARQELLQLQYKYEHGLLELPYVDKIDTWEIAVNEVKLSKTSQVVFSATQKLTNKEVVFKILND